MREGSQRMFLISGIGEITPFAAAMVMYFPAIETSEESFGEYCSTFIRHSLLFLSE
jgi:hypothetical protein